MNEIQIRCHVKGTRPLLMNSFFNDGHSPSKIRRAYDDQEEAMKRLYVGPEGQVCHPSNHLEACLVKSAAEFKFSGRKTYKDIFKSGVFVRPNLIPEDATIPPTNNSSEQDLPESDQLLSLRLG